MVKNAGLHPKPREPECLLLSFVCRLVGYFLRTLYPWSLCVQCERSIRRKTGALSTEQLIIYGDGSFAVFLRLTIPESPRYTLDVLGRW